MSTRKLTAARAIWRDRRARTGGDTTYTVYALVLVFVITAVPATRALWLAATSPGGVSLITSAHASVAVSLLVAGLWAGALLWGRHRGPALLPAFLLHALINSDIPRSTALRRPLLCAVAFISITLSCIAGLVGAALVFAGQAQALAAATFVATAAAAGVVTALAWLAGQVFPRAAFPAALATIALATLGAFAGTAHAPQLLALTPWGWVGASYPAAAASLLPLAGTVALATAFAAATPALLGRLGGVQLSAQAAQWERATAFSYAFEFRAAAASYAAKPRFARTVRAVRPGLRRWLTFFVRDAIGQIRTPERLLSGITATAIAGTLITLAALPGTPSALLAGTAGLVALVASGPLSQGLQHAANVAGDYPLYGISELRLVAYHTLFPLAITLAVLPAAAAATALVAGVAGAAGGIAVAKAAALGVFALALRLGIALKGQLPPSLLTPINTHVGDLSIIVQFGWAFSEPALAILGAVALSAFPLTVLPFICCAVGVGALIALRWKHRR